MTSERNPTPPATAAHTGGMLALPPELLRKVFGHFCDHRIPDPGREDRLVSQLHGDLVSNISNLRLTCRRFADAAAEFLLPQVHVTLDQATLDRVDEISRYPTLFRRVRRVCVNLDYRPKELAENLALFARRRIKEVKESLLGRIFPGFPTDAEGAGGEASRHDGGLTLAEVWDKEINGLPGDRPVSYKEAEYRRILVEGFAAYRRGHEEQHRLVEKGSFARGLAASISRMPRFDTLVIDNQDAYARPARPHRASVELLGSPFTWREIEYVLVGELAPARLLFELPVAMHAAGVSLKRFMLCGLPISEKNISRLAPVGEGSSCPGWGDVRAALGGVEYLQLQGLRRQHPRVPKP